MKVNDASMELIQGEIFNDLLKHNLHFFRTFMETFFEFPIGLKNNFFIDVIPIEVHLRIFIRLSNKKDHAIF